MKTMQHKIQSQEQWVLFRLERFYDNTENLERVREILDKKSKISLRLVDWFATNYSKKYNVSYMTRNNKHVIVYLAYKSHLKAYTKRMFDPFCRWKRIMFRDCDTTVGQLNFFEWAIQDEVLDYIEKNHAAIQTDMDTRSHEPKNDSSMRKRHELSRSATKSLKHHNVSVTVKFD